MIKKSGKFLTFVMILAMIFTYLQVSTVAANNVYYVSTNGSDSNPGTLELPFATIQKAADVVQPGDTVYVRGGTYHELVSIKTSGTESKRITFQSYASEVAIIDGQQKIPEGPEDQIRWSALVSITGNYITFQNFTVTGSRGRGVQGSGCSNSLFKNLDSNNHWNAAILFSDSTACVIENCKAWESSLCSSPENDDGGIHPGIVMLVDSQQGTIRNCEIYNNYSQGLIDLRSKYSIIEDNKLWDNLSKQLYLDNSYHSLVQRNLIYYTENKRFWLSATSKGHGVTISNESYKKLEYTSLGEYQVVVNNFIYQCGKGITFNPDQSKGSKLDHALFANNTIVNSMDAGISIRNPGSGSHVASRIENNIIFQSTGLTADVANGEGVVFASNNWSSTPPARVSSPTDIIGDPLLEMSRLTGPGQLTPDFFKLKNNSPVINRGRGIAEVTQDFFKTTRDAYPDMGGHEYNGPGPTNPPPTPTPLVSFKDVKTSDWFYGNVTFLVEKGVIGGYPDGTFKPGDNVNVDAFIKMVVAALGYTDIQNSTGYWANNYISKAKELKLVLENEFATYNRPITRGEMARIISRGLEAKGEAYPSDLGKYTASIKDYSKIKEGFGDYVVKAFSKGIITGYPDGEFKDTKNASRAEAATMIARLIDSSKRVIPVL